MRTVLSLILLIYLGTSSSTAQTLDTLRIYAERDHAPTDPNGFLLNPYWRGIPADSLPRIKTRCGFRVATGHLERRTLLVTHPLCLSHDELKLVTLNEASPTLGLGAVCVTGGKTGNVKGHVNWFPVTATGLLRWDSYSSGAQDLDVNINLVAREPNATTTVNKGYAEYPTTTSGRHAYHMESYIVETLLRLPAEGTSYWHALTSSLYYRTRADQLVDNRVALVTGLYNVDAVHGFHAELHPVYAMSILTDIAESDWGVRETWAVMVRNQGSEGDCSEGILPMFTSQSEDSTQDFVIDLGVFPDTAKPTVSLDTARSWVSSGFFQMKADYVRDTINRRHIRVHFLHPRPQPGSPEFLFLGTVQLNWPRTTRDEAANRFWDWITPGHPHINLSQIPDWETPRERDGIQRVRQAVSQALANQHSKVNAPIEELRPVSGIGSVSPGLAQDSVRPVLALKTLPWPVPEVAQDYHCGRGFKSDAFCLPSSRLLLGLSAAHKHRGSPLASFFVFPHGHFAEGDSFLDNLWNYFTLLGWRVDARKDRFFFDHSGITRGKDNRFDGLSFRGGPFISPNTFRVSPDFALSPFTIAQFGWSKLDEAWKPTWSWGLGMEMDALQHQWVFETQNSVRAGRFWSHWLFSAGILVPAFH